MSFKREAIDAGFTEKQAEFLASRLARNPHNHEIDQVEGLENRLDEIEETLIEAEEI